MSETDVAGVVSGVLEISELAAKVSVRLYSLSRMIKEAIKPLEVLSNDVASIGAVLNQLGHQLKKAEDLQVGSSTLVTSVDDLVEECSNVFGSIDKALDGNNTGSRAILGLQHYVHITSLKPQLVVLETSLDRLKTPLALMLNVLIYAEQLKRCVPILVLRYTGHSWTYVLTTVTGLCSQENTSLVKDQQELIRVLNEERKERERRFHKLTFENKTAADGTSTNKALRKGLPADQQDPSQEAENKELKARKIWTKEEWGDRQDRPTRKGSSFPRKISVIGRVSGRVRGKVRIPRRIRDEEDDDSSLLDMASFLKSTGPDTPHNSGEDTITLSLSNDRSRSQHRARKPVVRGDDSNLMSFFREVSPGIKRTNTPRTPRNIIPVRHITEPMTPPLTAGKDTDNRTPIPHQVSLQQTHHRSHSAGLPLPLGSHPPQFDTSPTATTKWALQAVLAWLEKNSFSAEWQETFKLLQIEGSKFIELGSGQGIRKMLTVIYPQLTRTCLESGKGWDQAGERAEGQRLRKLIRELPVDVKYEDGPAVISEKVMDGRPAMQSPAEADATSGGRRRAVTFPAKSTTPNPAPNQALNKFERKDIPPLPDVEEQPPLDAPANLRPIADQRREFDPSTVPDEWVRKWTVLSPEEIARGKEVASTWLID